MTHDRRSLSNPLVPRSNRGGRAENSEKSAAREGRAPSTESIDFSPSATTGTPEVHGSDPCRVPVGRGLFALVSPEDYARLSAHAWRLGGTTPQRRYARRTIRVGKGRAAPKRAVFMHRVVAGAAPGQFVDHVNGDTLDNRRENLRLCTAAENARNVRSSKNQKRGGFKGVAWHPKAKKWQAHIRVDRRNVYLGLHATPEDAARAYDRAAAERFGAFAALNFPEAARG